MEITFLAQDGTEKKFSSTKEVLTWAQTLDPEYVPTTWAESVAIITLRGHELVKVKSK